MLLLFVIILMVVGLAIIGTLYSLFVPFFQQLGDIKQYNMAYYGAVSSVERGMLSLRYHGPGFEAKSGFKDGQSMWNTTDTTDDLGRLGDPNSAMDWSVKSRTDIIPLTGQGNVPFALKWEKSEDYLVLWYSDLMEYNLDMDNTNDVNQYYTDKEVEYKRNWLESIALWARLPQKLYEEYGGKKKNPELPVCYGSPIPRCYDVDEDRIPNDLVIDWSMEGKYKQNNTENSFRIVPRVSVNYVSGTVRDYSDTLIRESHINDTADKNATAEWTDNHNPVASTSTTSIASQNIIAPGSVVNGLWSKTFKGILGDNSSIKDLKLLLGLARELKTKEGKMYPFLETKITADKPIPDLFYHLNGHGKVGDYDVTLNVKKPTSDRSLLGSFTIVF